MIREDCQDMGPKPRRERMAGLRFAQLIRQLVDDGMTMTAIAEAIGCDISLVSKWRLQGMSASHDVTRKGIRDDVIQGIYDGLGVRSDYLFMPTPKGYSNRVRLKSGDTRACDKHELDHKDFRVITHVELEIARDKKERAELRSEVADLRAEVRAGTASNAELQAQVRELLQTLGTERRSAR